jgi:phosphoenolpyruvate carboxylase
MNDTSAQAVDIDLNRLIPAYLAADAEKKQRVMAVLVGVEPNEEPEADHRQPERLLNQIEIAEVLNVHPTTVRRWRLPCHRLGRVPRYRMDEVMEYVASPAFRRRLKELKQMRDG